MSKTSEGSTTGAVVGGLAGAVTGAKIALGVVAATGGLPGAIVAPQIILCCTVAGAAMGYESPKSTVFSGMSAGGTLAEWWGRIAGS